MKYYISIIYCGDGDKRQILGEYDDLNTALKYGEEFSKTAGRGDVVSCIYGNLDYDNKFIGKYVIYNSWI